MLTNDQNILRYFYEEEHYHFAYIDGRKFEYFSSGIATWANCAMELNTLLHEEGKKIQKDINEYFNQHHGIVFCKKYTSNLEIFEFASQTRSIYFYDKSVFEKFFTFFKDAARKQIVHSSKEKIILPDRNLRVVKNHEGNSLDKLALAEILKTKNYYLSGDYRDSYLTKKEMLCCYFAYKGKSSIEIAEILNISKRTVEQHFNDCYIKFNKDNKLALISFLLEHINLQTIEPEELALRTLKERKIKGQNLSK